MPSVFILDDVKIVNRQDVVSGNITVIIILL